MNKRKDNNSKVLFLVDLILIYLNFLWVYVLYNGWGLISLDAVFLMIFIGILWFFISINTNILSIGIQTNATDIVKGQLTSFSVLSTGIIVSVVVFGNFKDSTKIILLPLLFSFLFSIIYRLTAIIVLQRIIKSGYKQKKVLIIGAGLAAEKVMQQIISFPDLGYRLYGIIAAECTSAIPTGYYLGDLSRFYDTVRLHLVDEVIIALPLSDEETIISMVEKCQFEGIRVRIVPDFFSVIRNRVAMEKIGEIPLIAIRTEPLSLLRNRIVKRAFDILFSMFALTITSPIFLVLAILIRITSPGPIFFKQKRIGSNNIDFYIYKFRSMFIQNRNVTDTKWTTKGDPRVTKIGQFIRKTSLDELPQFWNVLIGNMSVVGPRPEREYFIEEFKKHIRDYKVRHLVKSGITGWAQVNGWRGDTSIKNRIEHDIYYLENWNFWFDIRIIWMTIFGQETKSHAY